jgi:hypothetical protein
MSLPWVPENISQYLEKNGLATVLVFVGLATFIGVIPSPLSELQMDMTAHKEQTKWGLKEQQKQTRLLVEACIDRKSDRREDPKMCYQMLLEEEAKNEPLARR